MGSSVSDSRNDKNALQKAYQEDADDDDEESENDELPKTVDQGDERNLTNFSEFEIITSQKFKNKKLVTFRYRIIQKSDRIGCLGSAFKCTESLDGISSSRERVVIVKKLKYFPDLQDSMDLNVKLLEESLELHYWHIGRVLNCFKIGNNNENDWFIASEYYPLGNLTDLRKSMSEISISMVLQLVYQVILAIRFLNSRKMIHRNVKMENILVRHFSNEKLMVVLGDLGSICQMTSDSMEIPLTTASTFGDSDQIIDTSIIGTLGYRDPLTINKRKVHIKSDIWSFGITLLKFIFFTDLPPTVNLEEDSQENIEELLNYLFSPLEIKDSAWTAIKQLINGMLRLNIYERNGTNQILCGIFNAEQVPNSENLDSNYNLMKQVYRNHESVIATVLSLNGLMLQQMPDSIRKNKKLILIAIDNNPFSYEFVYETLKNDSEIMMKTYSKDPRTKYLFNREFTTKEFQELKKQPLGIPLERKLSENERNDFSFMSNLISKDGKYLSLASKSLKTNFEIVKKSLLSNGLALEFVPQDLRKIREFVEIAIDQNPLSLLYADQSFKSNVEIVKKAVQQNGLALEFVSSQLKLNKEIVRLAVSQNCKSLAFIPTELINDTEFMCSLLSNDSDSLEEYEKHWIETFDIFNWIQSQFRNNSKSTFYKNPNLLALYCILEENDLIQVDSKQLFEMYVESSNKKHAYALFKMGILYFHGELLMGIEKNLEMALQYFEQAAQLGLVDAFMSLSVYYKEENDNKKLVQYLTSAAMKGNTQAQFNLSELYSNDELKNSELSIKWLKKSAQNGNVEAQLSLAKYYEQEKEYILSFEWCQLAAEQAFPESLYQLGEKLMNGTGCQQNLPLAIQFFEKAVKEEHVLSMLNLGLIYFQSPSFQNHEKSLKFLLQASENGNIDAHHNIGYFYASKNEFEKALSWYMKSHQAGHPNSFSEISQMILRNELKFKKISGFIAKEAMDGNEEAIELLQELKERGEE